MLETASSISVVQRGSVLEWKHGSCEGVTDDLVVNSGYESLWKSVTFCMQTKV